jgi:restriction endonuclease S subunit
LTKREYWNIQEESRVFKNDILIYTTGANIGRTNIYLRSEKALASNHTNILRVKDENPVYVGFVLNSIIGRLQTEKMKTGSAQAEIYPSSFKQFIIPFIKKKKQAEIEKLYIQSFEYERKSKALVEISKRATEIAIELNEARGLTFFRKRIAQDEF